MGLYAPPPENTYGFRKCCEAVKAAVPIENVARRYTELRPLGGRAWFDGRCPLPDHDDHNPSFYIYPPERWWCYGCGRGGDVIDLEFFCGGYAELWGAMIALSVEYDVELPQRPPSWYRRQERQRPVRDALEEIKFRHVQRRLFRIFAPAIEQIADERERKEEKAQTWRDLRGVAILIVVGRWSA